MKKLIYLCLIFSFLGFQVGWAHEHQPLPEDESARASYSLANKQNAVQVLAQSVSGTCANQLGDWYGKSQVDMITHKLLHGILGSGFGAAVSKKPAEGAIVGGSSALAAECFAEMVGPSTEELQRKAQAGTLTQEDITTYQDHAHRSANAARLLTASLTALSGHDTETAITTSGNAIENNYNTHISGPKAQELSEEDFVQWHLEDWEAKYGFLSLQERELMTDKFRKGYYTLRGMYFLHDLLQPGQKQFEETVALPFEEFREQWLSNQDPHKLATPEGRHDAERILRKQYDYYQGKSIDLAVGSHHLADEPLREAAELFGSKLSRS